MDEEDLKERCRLGALWMWEALQNFHGHVSCRRPDGDGFFLAMVRVQASGLPYPVLTYDGAGRLLTPSVKGPSEVYLHSETYRRRPDVMAIAHSHPRTATALSTTDQPLYAVSTDSAPFGTGLPAFRGDLIDRPEIGAELAEALGNHVALLLQGHGVVTVGIHVPDAVTQMIYVEEAAQQMVWARLFGGARMLPEHLQAIPPKRTEGLMGDTYWWRQWMWDRKRRTGEKGAG